MWIVIVLLALILLWVIMTGNSFKMKDAKIKESLSGIEIALVKRYDVLTKLMDAAKGYMKHESTLILETIKLRKGMNTEQMKDASMRMDEAFKTLSITAEQYPNLRSSDTVVQLESGIRETEEHLQASRRIYNANVTAYNTSIITFPSSLIANAMHLHEQPLFSADEEKLNDVEIKL